jgi:hypothetical protein
MIAIKLVDSLSEQLVLSSWALNAALNLVAVDALTKAFVIA